MPMPCSWRIRCLLLAKNRDWGAYCPKHCWLGSIKAWLNAAACIVDSVMLNQIFWQQFGVVLIQVGSKVATRCWKAPCDCVCWQYRDIQWDTLHSQKQLESGIKHQAFAWCPYHVGVSQLGWDYLEWTQSHILPIVYTIAINVPWVLILETNSNNEHPNWMDNSTLDFRLYRSHSSRIAPNVLWCLLFGPEAARSFTRIIFNSSTVHMSPLEWLAPAQGFLPARLLALN